MRSLGPGPKIADRVGVGKLTEDFQDGFLPLSTTGYSGYIKLQLSNQFIINGFKWLHASDIRFFA
jgi:hypothetical protein